MKQEFLTIFLAMSPTLEAHGALAVALGLFQFSPLKAYSLTVLGSLLVTVPLLVFWHTLTDFLMAKVYVANRFLTWLFSYTKRRHTHHFSMFGEIESDPASRRAVLLKSITLYLFVAFPGPFTGVWAGTVAAFVFGIPFIHSVAAIAAGALTVAAIDLAVLSGFFRLIAG